MRTSVKINGSEVLHLRESLTLESRLSERVSTARIDVIGEDYLVSDSNLAITLSPSLGGMTRPLCKDEIAIDRGEVPFINSAISLNPALGGRATYLDKFFGGYIAIVDKYFIADKRIYRCQCHDYNSRLNEIKIDETYSGKTEAEIIEDLFDTYWSEVDTSDIDGTNSVPDIEFPDMYLGEALDMLAKMYEKEFYIDYDKKLHYFTPVTTEAPFGLSDEIDRILTTPLPHKIDSWREDAARLINRVTVIGNAVEVTRTDSDSYDRYGHYYDYIHRDNNINDTSWANLVGDSILAKSAFENIRGLARCWHEGLVVGQKVYIENKRWDLDDYYLIQSLRLKMISAYQEEITIEVGDYHRDLVGILAEITKLENQG